MSRTSPGATSAPRTLWRRWIPGGGHTSLALVWGLGVGEILLVAGIVLFFFGAKKIPEIAQGLGRGIRNFKGELTPGEASEDEPVPEERHVPSGERDTHRG